MPRSRGPGPRRPGADVAGHRERLLEPGDRLPRSPTHEDDARRRSAGSARAAGSGPVPSSRRERLVDERRARAVVADRVVRLVEAEQRVDDLEVASGRAQQLELPVPRRDRVLVLVGDLALVGPLAEQLDPRVGVEQVGVGHRAAVLEGRLAVRAETGRGVAGRDGELEDRRRRRRPSRRARRAARAAAGTSAGRAAGRAPASAARRGGPGVMPESTDWRTSSCRKAYAGASKRSIPAVTHSSTASADTSGIACTRRRLDARADDGR